MDDNPIWREQYNPYYEAPSCNAPYSIGQVKDGMLQEATSRLNALRQIAGLPAVTLDYDVCETAQYGAVLLAYVQQISHYVGRPSDMPEDFYSKANSALHSSNLAGGATTQTLFLHQVDMWMYDSDSSNISLLGHRNWQLNPTMGKVGFGYAGYASVEMSHDRSGAGCDYDYIRWPSSGNFPMSISHFDTAAWSVSLNQDVYNPFTKVVVPHGVRHIGKEAFASWGDTSRARPTIMITTENHQCDPPGQCDPDRRARLLWHYEHDQHQAVQQPEGHRRKCV